MDFVNSVHGRKRILLPLTYINGPKVFRRKNDIVSQIKYGVLLVL